MTKIILILAVFLSNLLIAAADTQDVPRFRVTYQPYFDQQTEALSVRTKITYTLNGEVYRTKYASSYIDEITETIADIFEFDENVDPDLKRKVTNFFGITAQGRKITFSFNRSVLYN